MSKKKNSGSQHVSIHSLKPACIGEHVMLKGPKDLKQERKGGGKKCTAGGLVGEILFDLPATAKISRSKDERLPETSKLWLRVSWRLRVIHLNPQKKTNTHTLTSHALV